MAEADRRPGPVAASPEEVGMVDRLLPRLVGDMSIETLDEQRRVQRAVSFICRDLLHRLDEQIIATYPANEDAVSLYFDYGHSRAVLHRLELMGAEMEAIIDLIYGGSAAAAGSVTFPD
ncbi:MAG: hypothetical protein JO306_06120 [Gemmatimonadetes bacterium]|nr:hypothetical protein [Gemmatimonadota bacterium]